jgi:hypothetical protein
MPGQIFDACYRATVKQGVDHDGIQARCVALGAGPGGLSFGAELKFQL